MSSGVDFVFDLTKFLCPVCYESSSKATDEAKQKMSFFLEYLQILDLYSLQILKSCGNARAFSQASVFDVSLNICVLFIQ